LADNYFKCTSGPKAGAVIGQFNRGLWTSKKYGANDPTFFSNMFEKSDLDCKIMGCRISRNPAVPGYWFKLRGRIFPAGSIKPIDWLFPLESLRLAFCIFPELNSNFDSPEWFLKFH
jgi:hypothetical protein